jgi:DNA-binding response OmpR family regulator
MLLVEDDDSVVEALVPKLVEQGILVDRLAAGRGALDRLAGVDVVLLDLKLPDVDGIELCQRMRAISDVPIIIVSALTHVSDRILGLHAGADDYVTKPFDDGELVARVHTVIRRGGGAHPPVGTDGEVITVGDVEIHLSRHEVVVAGERIALSRKQFQLLVCIAGAGGALCTRERVMTEIWQDYLPGREDELDQQVAELLAVVRRPWLIRTVPDVGYQLGRPAR